MNQFLESTELRIQELNRIIQEKEASLSQAPDGIVNIMKKKDRKKPMFYYKDAPDAKRRYLKASEHNLALDLCQKDYDQKVLKAAQEEFYMLEAIKTTYPKITYEDIYERLTVERKSCVKPVILSDEEFIDAWENDIYEKKNISSDVPEYYTEKGERVRSKSEILIANMLHRFGIPYKYECPLYLKGYGKIHPDFTVLNTRLRKELYLEHLGKMDMSEYAENACHRIIMYERNGIFPGDTLLLTYETLKYPLDMRVVEMLILRYLK